MPANLENSAVATGLEKVSFHSNPKEVQFSSVTQSCLTLCDPMNLSTPGLPVHHQLPEFTQTHIHRVSDAIQPSHPLSSPSLPAPNPSQHQSLFQWVNSLHEVAGWHHWLDGCESGWTPGVGDGQEGLACCDSWGRKESDNWATELNWTEIPAQDKSIQVEARNLRSMSSRIRTRSFSSQALGGGSGVRTEE